MPTKKKKQTKIGVLEYVKDCAKHSKLWVCVSLHWTCSGAPQENLRQCWKGQVKVATKGPVSQTPMQKKNEANCSMPHALIVTKTSNNC